MRILSVAEFDPANVLEGHRLAMKTLGVDYRLAVATTSPRRPGNPDHQLVVHDYKLDYLMDFAEKADIIQFHPGIGQPWSHGTTEPRPFDGEHLPFGPINWSDKRFSKARRISFFHGSRNAAVNATYYADYWRKRGHAIWTSTLDYADWMGATWAPPILHHTEDWKRAPLRGDDDPLIIAHNPTDPSNCHTKEITEICLNAGVVLDFVMNRHHSSIMKRKATANAGFDHLRGAFSVNTLENCAVGLVPLVGLKTSYRKRLCEEIGDPDHIFCIETVEDLAEAVLWLADEPEETRMLQQKAQEWFTQAWDPLKLGRRMLTKYEEVLG